MIAQEPGADSPATPPTPGTQAQQRPRAARRARPSLLEPQATGGEIAEAGFSFQLGVMLAQLPLWLAHEGFTAVTREAFGDIEVRYFVPHLGAVRELIETKDHRLTPAEFWREIARFRELDAGHPGTYRRFSLIAPGLSAEVQPVVAGLRRLRGALPFYGLDSSVIAHSRVEWAQLVTARGQDAATAALIFDKVLIDDDFLGTETASAARFKDAFARHFPIYQELPIRLLDGLVPPVVDLLRNHINRPIGRRQVEEVIAAHLGPAANPTQWPVRLHTAHQPDDTAHPLAIRFSWEDFFGGVARTYPPSAAWEDQVLAQLRATRDWILAQRGNRRIALTGERRLSAALAIGATFPAVAGFAVDLAYRGAVWPTDAHATAATPPYTLTSQLRAGAGDRLVVSVGIPRAVAADVDAALPHLQRAHHPALHLHGGAPIVSPDQANLVADQIKRAITAALAETGCAQIDLFFAGPSFLALFLGHRLNATAPIRCHEWVGPGRYVPTCPLFAEGA